MSHGFWLASLLKGLKYPNTEHIPKSYTTSPGIGTIYTLYLGALDP